jgi:hypothetical protein
LATVTKILQSENDTAGVRAFEIDGNWNKTDFFIPLTCAVRSSDAVMIRL